MDRRPRLGVVPHGFSMYLWTWALLMASECQKKARKPKKQKGKEPSDVDVPVSLLPMMSEKNRR